MTVSKERAMQMFDRDLEMLMDYVRGMQAHYQIADWEAFVFIRKPNCPESYVVKYAAADDTFAKQIVQLHTAAPPTTPSDAAMRAAEEISDALLSGAITENQIGAIAEIITRNLAPSASPEFASNYETVARQVVEGCSNWHDIQHKIVPRIVALLNTSETVELQIARRFLVKNGYERCASAACGCKSWHERRP